MPMVSINTEDEVIIDYRANSLSDKYFEHSTLAFKIPAYFLQIVKYASRPGM